MHESRNRGSWGFTWKCFRHFHFVCLRPKETHVIVLILRAPVRSRIDSIPPWKIFCGEMAFTRSDSVCHAGFWTLWITERTADTTITNIWQSDATLGIYRKPMVGKCKTGNGSIIGRTVSESEYRKSTLPRRTMAGFWWYFSLFHDTSMRHLPPFLEKSHSVNALCIK